MQKHSFGSPIPTPAQFTYDFFKPRARFNFSGPKNAAPVLQRWQLDDFIAKHSSKFWELSDGVPELCAYAAGLPISDEQHAKAVQALQWLYAFTSFTLWIRNPLPVGLVPKEHSPTSKKLPLATYPDRVNKMLRCLENPLGFTEAHLDRWLLLDPFTHPACETWTSRSDWKAGGLDIGHNNG